MKLIIDIDDELVETARFAVRLDMDDDYVKSIANGIPLENIKKELQNMQKEYRIRHDYPRADMLGYALLVIDKHMAESEVEKNDEI